MIIRPARPEEAPALSALARRSKAVWGYDEAFLAACAPELTVSPAMVATNPTSVIEEGGRLLGYYMLEATDAEEIEIEHLFVAPEAVGRGCGRRLGEHAKSTAAARGHGALVVQADPHAEGFYRALGGEPIGTRPSASIAGRDLPLLRIRLDPTRSRSDAS